MGKKRVGFPVIHRPTPRHLIEKKSLAGSVMTDDERAAALAAVMEIKRNNLDNWDPDLDMSLSWLED